MRDGILYNSCTNDRPSVFENEIWWKISLKKYLKKYSWNLNLYMFKQVWNCSRESFVMMFSWNEKSGIGVWKIIFLYRQSNEKKILLRDYYYIVCANFRLHDGVPCNRKLLEKRVYCDSQRKDGYLQSIWK